MQKKTISSNKLIKNYLPNILIDIENKYSKNPRFILDYWPKLIGKQLSPMTKAVSFENNTLIVLVKSSTLLSILRQQEKKRLLKLMQDKFSKGTIKNIVFKIG
jgi:Dna[CI] antecedent, DciA